MRNLQDKLALVTGAGSGIGRSIAVELAKNGCRLLLVDIDQEKLNAVADELSVGDDRVATYVCDLTDREQMDRMVEDITTEHRGVDILINNAGIAFYGPTQSMTSEQWDRLLTLNLLTPIQLAHRFLPEMLRRDEAQIVNICSMYGYFPGYRLAAYCTSKFGLLGFSESLRLELRRTQVGVTAICPGFVQTNFFDATTSGLLDRKAPQPPWWICTTAEYVARRVVTDIRWNARLVIITPLAHVLYWVRRIFPPIFDWLYGIPSFRRKKKKNK